MVSGRAGHGVEDLAEGVENGTLGVLHAGRRWLLQKYEHSDTPTTQTVSK